MDVVKDNVALLLRKVIKAAHPDMLQELVAGLSCADVQSARDARNLFNLFNSIYLNPRASVELVIQCLDFGWQLVMSPLQRPFVIPSCRQQTGEATAEDVWSIETNDVNHFGLSVIRAEAAGREDGHLAPSPQRTFMMKYIQRCLVCIKDAEALPAVLSTLYYLLRKIADMVRLCLTALCHLCVHIRLPSRCCAGLQVAGWCWH
jgi:hypothetical protein